jgi:hypothetical protein
MAGQIAPAVVVLFLMFSGYFLNESSIPVWIGWIKYLSFIRYAFQVRKRKDMKKRREGKRGRCVRHTATTLRVFNGCMLCGVVCDVVAWSSVFYTRV